MYLYHLNLQPPTYIRTCAYGSFTRGGMHEVAVARGSSHLQLLRLDGETGRLHSVSTLHLFCTITALSAFRLPGDSQDYLVIGSDSGRISILKWQGGDWRRVHLETFGRSGVRRTVPGEYVASDPRGRAIMIAAVERCKLVYTMNRDPADNTKLTISSPLEAHKSNVITFALVAVDVGYENPLFAALEVDTTTVVEDEESRATSGGDSVAASEPLAKMMLTFYEADLGLNHVTRKCSEPTVFPRANLLCSVPGGADGPGGVLVFGEGALAWHRIGHSPVVAHLPIRQGRPSVDRRPILVVSASPVRSKMGFFFLAHTEEGDLLRVSLDHHSGEQVSAIRINYFDTIPVGSAIQVFRNGFLFLASEWASHRVYQIQALGTDRHLETYQPSAELTNLVVVDQLENYAEITDARLMNLGEEETPQIYAVQGRAHHSTFNIMRQGLHVTEVAASELPAEPTGVWTLKRNLKDAEHAYIVVSFADSTVVLSVGETVEEATGTGFLTNVRTIWAGQLADSSLIQVYPHGVRQVRPNGHINDWQSSPGGAGPSLLVTCAAMNSRQVVIAVERGEGRGERSLVYFETDTTGILLERKSLPELPERITSLALGPVPPTRQRSRFLAVGSADLTVRILSCDPDECLEPLSLQALAANATALLISERLGRTGTEDDEQPQQQQSASADGGLVLEVGLENGVLARLSLDTASGALTDARIRYLGSLPVKLGLALSEAVQGHDDGAPTQRAHFALLALSSRPWLGYRSPSGQAHLAPLSYESLTAVAPFASAQCPAGVVGLKGDSLVILMIESVDDRFTKQSVALEGTPRKLTHHPATNLFAIIESDHRALSPEERVALEASWVGSEGAADLASLEDGGGSETDRQLFTHLAQRGRWNSALRIFGNGGASASYRFTENEALVSLCFISFHDRLNELYLAVGVAKDLSIAPRHSDECAILLFLVDPATPKLTLTHRTALGSAIPSALSAFGGRLLAGVGSVLRLYDIGKRQLLRKCEAKLPFGATTLQSQGWRVFVGDAQASVVLYQYLPTDNRFQLVADDTQPRPVTAILPLDYDTFCVADRLGSIYVLRLPAAVSEDLESEISAGAVSARRGRLFGAPFKLERLAEFYLDDAISWMSKGVLSLGAREVIFYGTISGAMGLLMPFTSREEALLCQNLELALRMEGPATLTGRDHLLYRSYYAPAKSIIDGDLLETFARLPGDRQFYVAQAVDKSPSEVLAKLQDLRITAGV